MPPVWPYGLTHGPAQQCLLGIHMDFTVAFLLTYIVRVRGGEGGTTCGHNKRNACERTRARGDAQYSAVL
jgi:hypothetical protein